jgi:uncharacterized damage-inducible protein DinB
MNAYKDAIASGLQEYLDGLKRVLHGLTPAELRWQPTLDSNPILWLAWHMARVEDDWMNERVHGGNGLWRRHGWREKLGFETEGSGFGDTPDDVRAMPDVSIDAVMAYYEAVREAVLNVLDGLTEEDFEKEVPHPRRKNLNLRWVLGHVLVEEAQHLGQIAYVRGMIRGSGN